MKSIFARVFLVVLIITLNACSPETGLSPAAPATSSAAPEKILLTQPAPTSPAPSATLPPTASPSPTSTPEPSPTPEPVWEEIQIHLDSPIQKVERNLNERQVVPYGTIFYSYAEGVPDVFCELPKGDLSLPLIGSYEFLGDLTLCLVGFPENEPIRVEVTSPDGQKVSQTFSERDGKGVYVDPETRQVMPLDDWSGERLSPDPAQYMIFEDASFIAYAPILFPAPGLVAGVWNFSAVSGEARAETEMIFEAPGSGDVSRISVFPSQGFNPFLSGKLVTYTAGDTVYAFGAGASPGKEVAISAYRQLGYVVWGRVHPSGSFFAEPLWTQKAPADSAGRFGFSFQISLEDEPGFYCLSNKEQMSAWHSGSCYRIGFSDLPAALAKLPMASYSVQTASSEEIGVLRYNEYKLFESSDPPEIHNFTVNGPDGPVELLARTDSPDEPGVARVRSDLLLLHHFAPGEKVRLLVYYAGSLDNWQDYQVDASGQLLIRLEANDDLLERFFYALGEVSQTPEQPHLVFSCPGALPPRLGYGMPGQVAFTDGRPLRVWLEPGFSSVVVNGLPEGTEFIVNDGPRCVDGIVWWLVEPGGGLKGGWVSEGKTEYLIEP